MRSNCCTIIHETDLIQDSVSESGGSALIPPNRSFVTYSRTYLGSVPKWTVFNEALVKDPSVWMIGGGIHSIARIIYVNFRDI